MQLRSHISFSLPLPSQRLILRQAREAALAGRCMAGTVDSWLLWHWTGRHCTDSTNASRTQLMDLATRKWSNEAMSHFFALCPLMQSLRWPTILPSAGAGFGVAHKGPLAGIRIAAVLGDQQAALLGQGCIRAGQGKVTYGTGVFALLHTCVTTSFFHFWRLLR